jgi:hypothetical protein
MSAQEPQEPPSEAELRAAYERELSRMTSADVIAQAAVSLLNIAAVRLRGGPEEAGGGRDLDQVRDAIDGAGALLSILERTMPSEVRSLRSALSQLQLAYAAEVRGAGGTQAATGEQEDAAHGGAASAGPPAPDGGTGKSPEDEQGRSPGPAESSGRLWVPGR